MAATMAGVFVVVLLVASGDGADPSIKTAAKTTHDALEGDAIVIVREVEPERLNDVEAATVATSLDANAVAIVTWRNAQHSEALVHVRAGRPDWVDRSFRFADGDPTTERGRTIGFAVASIISSPPAPPLPPTERPPSVPRPDTRPTASTPTRVAFDLLGAGAVGTGAGGLGGDLAGRLWFHDHFFAVRLGAGARAGTFSDAGASVLVGRFAAGAALRFFPRRRAAAFDLGGRVDAVALWHRLSRSDTASQGSFVTPGIVGMLEAAWTFAPPFALVAGIGAEVALGPIRVLVDDRPASTIEPVRGVVELGLRWEP